MRMNKNFLILVILLVLVVISYLLGVLAYSSKEARQKKWEEYIKENRHRFNR